MDASKIDITELAELLEDRKNDDQKIALILGSRTGALFRSQSFIEEMAPYSTNPHSFADMNERECFNKCYNILSEIAKKQNNRRDIEILLNQKISSISLSVVDKWLAELVEQKVFKLILSANADDLLYNAFTEWGLKEKHDFVDFALGRLSITDSIDEIESYEKTSACKVVKFYNDVDAFVHSLDKPQMQQEIGQCVKKLLERMKIKEILVVGIDLTWDHMILSALPPKLKTVWFVNEDEHIKAAFRSTYEGIEQFRFITGGQGGYEKFLGALHWRINPGISARLYEWIGRLQNQLNVVQHKLTNIEERLKSHQEYPSEQAQTDASKNTEKPSHTSNGMSADVLLITVTDIEAQAIFDLFPDSNRRPIHGRIYYDLGLVGTAKTFMAQSTGAGPTRARTCIETGIQALSPLVVIMVGIAFSLHPEKHNIGDILVSQQIEDYDQQKIGTGPNEQLEIYPRGDRVQASERLLNRFRDGRHQWQAPPNIHFGLILSGSKLISHKGFRDELLRVAPEAIGGEMEGISLYEVGNHKHIEWILVKAVCDWADADKNDAHQRLAAANAARFVIQVVGQEQFVHQR
jgi:nucleoside phosphorylase